MFHVAAAYLVVNEPFNLGCFGHELAQNCDHCIFAKHLGDGHVVVFAVVTDHVHCRSEVALFDVLDEPCDEFARIGNGADAC